MVWGVICAKLKNRHSPELQIISVKHKYIHKSRDTHHDEPIIIVS